MTRSIDYGNLICANVFSGSFTSADNYASSSAIGTIGAQTKTSETVAQQQVDSIQDRLDELQDEFVAVGTDRGNRACRDQ